MNSQRLSHLLAGAVVCCVAVPTLAGDCPELVGRWPYGPSYALAASGNEAYFGNGTALMIADVSNPAAPEVVGELDLLSLIRDIDVSDMFAYVAVGEAGLRVVDVSTPSNPIEVAFIDTPGDARDVSLAEHYAFVADGAGGLRILDVSIPEHPFELYTYREGVEALAVTVSESGERAYVAFTRAHGHGEEVVVIDLSNRSGPRGLFAREIPSGTTSLAFLSTSAPLGRYLFVAGRTGLAVLNVAVDSRPYEVFHDDELPRVDALSISGKLVFLGLRSDEGTAGGAVVIFDFSTPSMPVRMGYVEVPSGAVDLAASGGHVYVAADQAGLRVIDVSDVSSPFEVGFVDTPGHTERLAVTGDYAYVTGDGLTVFDVREPSNPERVAVLEGAASDVVVAGGHAYVAAGHEGLRIIDVTDPTSPREVSGLAMTAPLGPGSVTVSGRYAYIAAADEGLRVLDVSDPESPLEIGWLDITARADSVASTARNAYVLYSYLGTRFRWGHALAAIDVSIPSLPFPVGASCTCDGLVAASGDYVYLGGLSGLFVFDISTPRFPVEVGFVETPDPVASVTVSDGLALVTTAGSGLQIIDVSAPESPRIVGSYDTPGRSLDVDVAGEYAYITDDDAGLEVFDVSGCDRHASHLPTPR